MAATATAFAWQEQQPALPSSSGAALSARVTEAADCRGDGRLLLYSPRSLLTACVLNGIGLYGVCVPLGSGPRR